jgi:hypothetical protein
VENGGQADKDVFLVCRLKPNQIKSISDIIKMLLFI